MMASIKSFVKRSETLQKLKKEVKPFGDSSHIILPKKYIGYIVHLNLPSHGGKNSAISQPTTMQQPKGVSPVSITCPDCGKDAKKCFKEGCQ